MARKKMKSKKKSFSERMASFGKRMEKKRDNNGRGNGLGFGLFLVIIGLVWMGNDLGWWQPTPPLWPTILVAFGSAVVLSEFIKLLRR